MHKIQVPDFLERKVENRSIRLMSAGVLHRTTALDRAARRPAATAVSIFRRGCG
jgi:hypothetical protein